MTFFGDLREVGLGVASRVQAFIASARRTPAAVLGRRLTVFGALIAASALVFPAAFLQSWWFYVVAGTALAGAFWPRTSLVGVTIGALVALHVILTLADEGTPPLW